MWKDSAHWKRQIPRLEFIAEKSVWRKGASWSALLLLVLVFLSSFVSYADLLTGPIKMYSSNPPIHLIVKQSGQYALVDAIQNQQVREYDILAVLQADAAFADIKYLHDKLDKDDISFLEFGLLDTYYPKKLSLGLELQRQYSAFLQDYMQYVRGIQFDTYFVAHTSDSLKYLKSNQLLNTLKRKERTEENRLKLAHASILRNETLLTKGVISQGEFDKQLQHLNTIKTAQEQVRSESEAAAIENLNFKKIASNASNAKIYDLPMQKSLLHMQRQELLETVENWERKHIIKSPMDGTISLIKPLAVNQYVRTQEHIMTIMPLDYGDIIAECQLPIWNSGRLKEGMRVHVNLENFPSREWGQLKGRVASYSETPMEDGVRLLSVKVVFKDLVSTYGKTIDFRQEMFGSAEIVLEDVSLIQRIGYGFKDLWAN